MKTNNTAWKVVENEDDLALLKEQAKRMTLIEMANEYGLSKSKMYIVLRIHDIKAKRPERKKRPPKIKVYKKDHEVTKWAMCTNKGRVRYVYYDMLRRCYNPNDNHYKDYGGRGIAVCSEWKNDCCAFYKWAKENGYKEGLQLDRMDNNGNYEPDNCHWVTPSENAYNKRNTRLVTYNGKTMTLLDWEKETGIPKVALADRIYKYKWSIERALTQPYIARG